MLGTTVPVSERRRAFRQGLASGRLLRFPGAFNPLSALLIEQYGFEGVYVSGAVVSADLGLPDIGLTTLSEVGGRAHAIARVTGLPALVDADTGFGEPMNAARTVQHLEELGLAGCHIEDQVNPKRCGHLDGKSVVGRDEMCRRLAAAVGARRDRDFVVCARTDARAVEGLEAAIERAKTYAAAGADMIFPEALEDEHEFEAFRAAIDVPLLANMTEFGKSTLLSRATLESLGVNVAIYPVTLFRLAMGAAESGLERLAAEGDQRAWSGRCRAVAVSTRCSTMRVTPPLTTAYTTSRSRRPMRPNGWEELAVSDDEIHKGLDGVVVDTTAVSMVNPETNSLTYRGYPVQQLAASCSFEEVAYLIWNGELPGDSELASFVATERSLREIPEALVALLLALPIGCHPMDVLRTALSWLGAADPREDDASREANLAKSLEMMAKIPTIVALDQRRRRGGEPIAPDPSLGFAENFFAMCFGGVPEAAVVRCFEISLVLYAEHSFNASTFTARVVTSTLSDIYSAVAAAVGALKGPLHGGANEAVMHMMDEIGDPARAVDWLHEAFASKRLVMGFGHRVYKHGDSRVPTMRAALEEMATLRGGEPLMAMYANLEAAMIAEKGIHPNLDFPSGPAYHLMGFDTEMFTPIFVISRITGWTAHVVEQLQANSLIRPLSRYVGPAERSLDATRAARSLSGQS